MAEGNLKRAADKDWCSKNSRKARQIKMLIMDCFQEES